MMIYPPHLTPSRIAILDDLAPDMAARTVEVLRACSQRNVKLVPYFGRRDALTQACFWRQSRSRETISAECKRLHKSGAPKIAEVIESVGPQTGRWATNALPGQSAHQYGLAIDCFVLNEKGEAIWDGNAKGYEVYAREAERAGLLAGAAFNDPVHIECRLRPYEPGDWASIQAALEDRGML